MRNDRYLQQNCNTDGPVFCLVTVVVKFQTNSTVTFSYITGTFRKMNIAKRNIFCGELNAVVCRKWNNKRLQA